MGVSDAVLGDKEPGAPVGGIKVTVTHEAGVKSSRHCLCTSC